MKSEKTLFNDEIDLSSLLSVLFDNFNLLLSIFITSLFAITIYYFSSDSFYRSNSLLSINSNNSSFLPNSLQSNFISEASDKDFLKSEIEIYRSDSTIKDALDKIYELNIYEKSEIPSSSEVRKNLDIFNSSKDLMIINLTSKNKRLSKDLLALLNEEFINDRKNFFSESSAAGRRFIQGEIPRIKSLLRESEDNLNSYKVATNTSDIIFDTNTRNFKLEELKDRLNEIIFKEVELKEFYKESHPIYLTLTEQKNLVSSQISEIEQDLPTIPSTQRAIENLRREVEIYSGALRELSSQELSLSMAEASSLSNVRIINSASEATKVFPRLILYLISLLVLFIAYIALLFRHFLGDRISNFDALVDYVGKERIIGELPLMDTGTSKRNQMYSTIAEELLNRTIYDMTHNTNEGNSFSIISSRKGEGKTELAARIFNKLKINYKVCLVDLDYRKKGLTKVLADDSNFESFEEFNENRSKFESENGSLFIPSLIVDSPPDFFTSKEFSSLIISLKEEFDYVLCDTPPWRLFIDAKIISNLIDNHMYVVSSNSSSFKDIDLFSKEIDQDKKVTFFYNKFKLYFNFLWYQYQYPNYSKNYYYDYQTYSQTRKSLKFSNLVLKSVSNLYNSLIKWLRNILKP